MLRIIFMLYEHVCHIQEEILYHPFYFNVSCSIYFSRRFIDYLICISALIKITKKTVTFTTSTFATYANIKSAKEEQFEIAILIIVYAMSQSIRTTLTPLLMISYIFGLRIANLPIVHASLWFSLLYMLIVWVIYYFLLMSALVPFLKFYISIGYYICYLLELFTTLLSIVFEIYHNAALEKSCDTSKQSTQTIAITKQ